MSSYYRNHMNIRIWEDLDFIWIRQMLYTKTILYPKKVKLANTFRVFRKLYKSFTPLCSELCKLL